MDYVHSQLGSQFGVIPTVQQVLPICRSDRWQVHYRLQELGIASDCLASGDLLVEIVSPVQIVQVRSVLQSLLAPRAVLLAWLDRCWQLNG